MRVTGCNYGVHPFEFAGEFGQMGMHLHRCPLCGAEYLERGSAGCMSCLPRAGRTEPVASDE